MAVVEVVLYHRFARGAADEQQEKRDQHEQRADHEAFQHHPVLVIQRRSSAQQLAHVPESPLQLEHKPASEWAHATCRLLFPARRFALKRRALLLLTLWRVERSERRVI